MPTDVQDRGPKMSTKTRITRDREWPEAQVESSLENAETRVALESSDRGTGMSTKTRITRDREWPKLKARVKEKVSAAKKKAARKKTSRKKTARKKTAKTSSKRKR